MMPIWKLRREVRRLGDRILSLLRAPFRGIAQARHDRSRHLTVAITEGVVPLGPRIAILVLHQPRGVPASILSTLRNLVENGFAPFVVSNGALALADHSLILQQAALVMTRPNFGYDFGAYRDAAMHLWQAGTCFEVLAFINDSIWFPLVPGNRHLQEMASRPENLIGYNFATARDGRRNGHAQSYFFAFANLDSRKRDILFDYWARLRVASDREFTVRQGEMRMTRHFADRGFVLGSLFGVEELVQALAASEPAELSALVDHLERTAHRRADAYRAFMAEGTEGLRAALIADARAGALGRNLIKSEAQMVFGRLGFAAMKKSREHSYLLQKRDFLTRCDMARIDPVIRAEIETQLLRTPPREP
jgi:hypothetical protein